MKPTKQEALDTIEELKKYVADEDGKEKPKGYVIRNRYDNSEIFVSIEDNIKDAVMEAVEQEANLEEANLEGANLKEADLWGANLKGANLKEANLEEANLERANLKGANLKEANLEEANLEGANLWGVDLWGANLEGANLRGVDLCNAKFYGIGGTSKLKKNQVETFLKALGFVVED